MRSYVLLALTGCSFSPALPSDGPKDASADTGENPFDSTPGIDGTPTMPCFGPAGWEICLSAVPTDIVTIAGTLDTTDDSKCAMVLPASWTTAGQPDACIIIGERIDVTGSDVQVTGTRPLVLVASDMINIAGTLDVGSHRDPAKVGPGAPSPECTTGRSPETEGRGGGGGAGGSFMSEGGRGGDGDAGDEDAAGGSAAEAVPPPAKLRAGCRGQTGAQSGGTSGQGGGAVYLVAGVSITGGRIDASGAGGTESGGGASRSGGSGGGSGGMVVLFAPAIQLTSINANGGGGASGANTPGSGESGGDADVAAPTTAAQGGVGGGGTGGDGSAGNSGPQSGSEGAATVGGGGGGGGAGAIRANVKPSNALSPPYTGV